VSADEEDEEMEYGEWQIFSHPAPRNPRDFQYPPLAPKYDWPHWSQGVPRRLSTRVTVPAFKLGLVSHEERQVDESLELEWNIAFLVETLKSNPEHLPSNLTFHSSGVYRLFAPRVTINRCCGSDPTGTLYIGRAGMGERNWSILRTRMQELINGQHHVMRHWSFCATLRKLYPWDSLAVEWAYTGRTNNTMGKEISEAARAESLLLRCYYDSFGELPPCNHRG